jgi:hypothetical protein
MRGRHGLGWVWIVWATGLHAQVYSDKFSPEFRAEVDRAMEAQTGDERSRRLVQALRNGSDSEVFFVFPLLFSADVLSAVNAAGLCKAEVTASLANLAAYLESPAAEQANYPARHATGIRADTDRTVRCISQYYENGQLKIPSKPSDAALDADSL